METYRAGQRVPGDILKCEPDGLAVFATDMGGQQDGLLFVVSPIDPEYRGTVIDVRDSFDDHVTITGIYGVAITDGHGCWVVGNR